MAGFEIHPEAFADLDEIRAHIAEESPDAADRLVDELFGAMRQLAEFPRSGFRRSNLTSRSLRFWVVRDYVLVYAPEREPVGVIGVLFHGRRNPRRMATILRRRE